MEWCGLWCLRREKWRNTRGESKRERWTIKYENTKRAFNEVTIGDWLRGNRVVISKTFYLLACVAIGPVRLSLKISTTNPPVFFFCFRWVAKTHPISKFAVPAGPGSNFIYIYIRDVSKNARDLSLDHGCSILRIFSESPMRKVIGIPSQIPARSFQQGLPRLLSSFPLSFPSTIVSPVSFTLSLSFSLPLYFCPWISLYPNAI